MKKTMFDTSFSPTKACTHGIENTLKWEPIKTSYARKGKLYNLNQINTVALKG